MAKTVNRVEFFTNEYQLASGKYIAVLREVFGPRAARWANCAQGLWIECSPEDFIKFQIRRDAAGINNAWKTMKVRQFAILQQEDPQPARELFF